MSTPYMDTEVRKSRVVGVLGGMGPYATHAFFKMILDLTPAQKDWDHLRIIIDNNPQIPSRTRHFLYNETSPLSELLSGCRQLERYPVDVIAIPCNSAMAFVPALRAEISVPVINICEVTVEALVRRFDAIRKVLVLGGYVTYTESLYETYLARNGMDLVRHGPQEQQTVMKIIEDIKLDGRASDHDAHRLIEGMVDAYEADAVILGCTELSLLSLGTLKVPVIDSTHELASFLIDFARGDGR